MWRHALPPAVGVVLGAIVGLLLNVATDRGTTAAMVGVAVATVVAAGWEGWWAVRHHGSGTHPRVTVRQRVRRNRGRILGAVGPTNPEGVDVHQDAGTNDGTVIGYTDPGPTGDRYPV